MGVVVLAAVQAPTNVEKGKAIATLMLDAVAVWNVAKAMVLMTTAILHWDSLLIMTAAMILQKKAAKISTMEMEEHPAAQAPTNVEQGKEIAILMSTVLAI